MKCSDCDLLNAECIELNLQRKELFRELTQTRNALSKCKEHLFWYMNELRRVEDRHVIDPLPVGGPNA